MAETTTLKTLKAADLAAKYARQIDIVEDLRRTAEIAHAHMARESRELEATAQALKDLIGRNRPTILIPIGSKRHVLVHSTSGSFGNYAAIDIVEESQ